MVFFSNDLVELFSIFVENFFFWPRLIRTTGRSSFSNFGTALAAGLG